MVIEGTPTITNPTNNNILQSFSDATAGRSLQLYYAVRTVSGKVLVRDPGVSYPPSTTGAVDYDFDITINKPTIIAGICTIDVKVNDAAGAGFPIITTFNLYHYDGSTETSIGTCTKSNDTGGAETYKLEMTLTKKLFKIGDTLRLNMVTSGSGAFAGTVSHDPNTAGNELKIWIPIVNLE